MFIWTRKFIWNLKVIEMTLTYKKAIPRAAVDFVWQLKITCENALKYPLKHILLEFDAQVLFLCNVQNFPFFVVYLPCRQTKNKEMFKTSL